MASNSVITQAKLKEFYDNYIYPYLNGSAHSGYTPIGTIISLMGNSAPDNYLVCDGTIYNITDYPLLASYFNTQFGSSNYFGGDGTTTFAVPDLQGEFLRGSGTNSHSGEGSGSTVGTHQAGTIHIGWETAGSYSYAPLDRTHNTPVNCDVKTNGAASSYYYKNSGTNTEIHTSYYTARPTNTSVLFCIAYQNIYIDSAVGNYPVEVTSPTDGQLLMYDATAGRWVNGGHIYSAEEHIVGTWINGKPLYEKTISVEYTTSTTDKTTSYQYVSIGADVEYGQVVNSYRVQSNEVADGTQQWLTASYPDYFTDCRIFLASHSSNPNTVCISTNRSGVVGATFIITIQYTKTTD